MKKINSIIYGLFGAGAILYGAVALIAPAFLVSEAAQSFHLRHIFREEGAAAVFIGLIAFWCIFNYERRAAVHYCLMVFALLLAAIHWFDHFAGHLGWFSPLYNSVPLVVLSIMALLSRKEMSAERQPSSRVTYPRPENLLDAMQVDKLELEITGLQKQKEWENIARLMPIIATLIGVLGFSFTVFVFASQQSAQQERDRESRRAEQRIRLQDQIRSDADEILRFPGGQKPARSRVVFLLNDMNTILNTKLSTGQTLGDESPEYRRSLTKSLTVLVLNDYDFNKDPGDVGLANAIAENWDDYCVYLNKDPSLKSLDHILFKYIEALKSFHVANPGYLESFRDAAKGYEIASKYDDQKVEERRYRNFIDLRDGIVRHLNFLGTGSLSERAQSVKKNRLEEFEGLICNPTVSKDALGKDFAERPCDY